MSIAHTHQPTLASVLWPEKAAGGWLRWSVLAFVGTLLIAVSAKISVPFYPVPMTMQTFAILTLSVAYGGRLAAATLLLYLAEGALGLPVFTGTPEKGIGLAYMMGPTGGYLLGFAVAAAIVGFLSEWTRQSNPLAIFAITLLGLAVIFAFGLAWLGTLIGWDKPVLALGLYPFIWGGLAKLALGTAVITLGWRFIDRFRG